MNGRKARALRKANPHTPATFALPVNPDVLEGPDPRRARTRFMPHFANNGLPRSEYWQPDPDRAARRAAVGQQRRQGRRFNRFITRQAFREWKADQIKTGQPTRQQRRKAARP